MITPVIRVSIQKFGKNRVTFLKVCSRKLVIVEDFGATKAVMSCEAEDPYFDETLGSDPNLVIKSVHLTFCLQCGNIQQCGRNF